MNPMSMSEERLLAYVDGELDATAAAEVEATLRTDAEAARFVAREQALRVQLRAAFDPVLTEPVPDRLMTALRGQAPVAAPQPRPAPAPVADLLTERQRRRTPSAAGWQRAAWPTWLGLAASVLLGVFVGLRLQSPTPTSDGSATALGGAAAVVADAGLAQALATERAAQAVQPGGVQVGISFVSRSGDYCRSFTLSAQAQAGLACQHDGQWKVQVLARADDASSSGAYRQAGTAMPAAVLQAIDAQIEGVPLDAQAEAAAIRHGWRR